MSTLSTTHPAAALVRRARDLVPAHPSLEPYRLCLAVAAGDPVGHQQTLHRMVRDLRRNGYAAAAEHLGLALLALVVLRGHEEPV